MPAQKLVLISGGTGKPERRSGEWEKQEVKAISPEGTLPSSLLYLLSAAAASPLRRKKPLRPPDAESGTRDPAGKLSQKFRACPHSRAWYGKPC